MKNEIIETLLEEIYNLQGKLEELENEVGFVRLAKNYFDLEINNNVINIFTDKLTIN